MKEIESEDEDEELIDIETVDSDDDNHKGRKLLKVGDTEEQNIFLHHKLAEKILLHQFRGVQFMWENVICEQRGCILAHAMGAGKTFQVIALIHTIFNYGLFDKFLVVTPAVVIYNWGDEIAKFMPKSKKKLRYYIRDSIDQDEVIKKWHRKGGILLISFESFTSKASTFTNELINPGPDIIILDEGHRVKDEKTLLTNTLSQVATRRRIVLTGTPLQNSLAEYRVLVNFVNPEEWTSSSDFNTVYGELPKGSYSDSSAMEVKKMYQLLNELKKIVEPFMHRFGEKKLVFENPIPPKKEWIITCKISPLQARCFKIMKEFYPEHKGNEQFLATTTISTLLGNHPEMARRHINGKLEEEEDKKKEKVDILKKISQLIEIEKTSVSILKAVIETGGRSHQGLIEKSEFRNCARDIWEEHWPKIVKDEIEKLYVPKEQTDTTKEPKKLKDLVKENIPFFVCAPLFNENYKELLKDDLFFENGSKIAILIDILKAAVTLGEKTLVFTQNKTSLSVIEDLFKDFLNWTEKEDYFVLRGNTSNRDRQEFSRSFNDAHNKKVKAFLVSTKAGGLGINLTGATRVVCLDQNWNPSIERQCIGRAFRLGQKKPVFVYTLLAAGTSSEVIYKRGIQKQALFNRLIDSDRPPRTTGKDAVKTVLTFCEEASKRRYDNELKQLHGVCGDSILQQILSSPHVLKVVNYESLLEGKEELE